VGAATVHGSRAPRPGLGSGVGRERTGDLYINAEAHFAHVPETVWTYQLGGYPVLKKWLGYRQADRHDGKPLSDDERRRAAPEGADLHRCWRCLSRGDRVGVGSRRWGLRPVASGPAAVAQAGFRAVLRLIIRLARRGHTGCDWRLSFRTRRSFGKSMASTARPTFSTTWVQRSYSARATRSLRRNWKSASGMG
jgi:Type ISP C-terminal specificity domain